MSSTAALDFWATPGPHTGLGGHRIATPDIASAVDAAQGLLVYDLMAADLYGASLSPDQAATINERRADRVLDAAVAVDERPLADARPPGQRVGARCHLYSKLTVAFLRAAGVPARARCGFATNFLTGWYEDHWIVEHWDGAAASWKMADAQLDEEWRTLIGFDADPLDLPAGTFITAGHAWQAWRRGELDADRCGLSSIDEAGSFWIAGNLRLDLAALNKVEMCPWDVWGAGLEPGEEPDPAVLALFDEVAELTTAPDDNFDELRRRYDTDEQLRMLGTVVNALSGIEETVEIPS